MVNAAVAIVGAGPAGLMLAHELGFAGIEVVIFERRTQPRLNSPGVAFNAGASEALELRGLMNSLRKQARPLPFAHFSIIALDLTKLCDRYRNSTLVNQTELESCLLACVEDLGVEIRWGTELISMEQSDSAVLLTTRAVNDGSEQRASCRYLVGCDGEDSTVRRLANINFSGVALPVRGIVGDIVMTLEDVSPLQVGAHYCPSGGVYTCALMGPRLLRLMTAEFGVSPWDDEPPPTFDDLNASIRRLTGNELKPCETRWLARTGGNIKLADNFSAGNVFLAGDAAHVIFPLNGQALDSAFQDAINLGWKLIATIRGWAPADLLSTYHDERYSAAGDMCMNVRAQVVLAHKAEVSKDLREIFRDLLQFDEVNKRLAEMILGVDVRYPLADAAPAEGSHPLLGRRFPQALLETASADGRVMRSLQDCRGVLLNLSGIADPSLAEVSSGWKERVDVVTVSDPLPELAATAVLLRPDAYVVWACTLGTPADARLASLHSALTAWFGPHVS